MSYGQSDEWYFGDYLGRLPGRYYSLFLNFVIILLFAQIALTTEPSLQTRFGQLFLKFLLNGGTSHIFYSYSPLHFSDESRALIECN